MRIIFSTIFLLGKLLTVLTQYATTEQGYATQECFDTVCFIFDQTPRTYSYAHNYCNNILKGNLLTIGDRFKQNFIQQKLISQAHSRFWIGLQVINTTKMFYQWVNNDTSIFSYWDPVHKECPQPCINQPDILQDVNVEENPSLDPRVKFCASIQKNGWWNLNSCFIELPFICETSRKEFVYKVYPTLEPGICNSGWYGFNGYCYKAFEFYDAEGRKNWMEAREACKIYKGDLASILTREENHFISVFIRDDSTKYWIGLNRINSSETRVWSDGSPVTFYSFSHYQPSNKKDLEKCVQYESMASDKRRRWFTEVTKVWTDYNCYLKSNYICKVKSGLSYYLYKTTTTYRPPFRDPYPAKINWQLWKTSLYYISNDFVGWQSADKTCTSLDGHLLTINDMEELFFIVGYINQLYDTEAWIGMTKLYSNKFEWIDKKEITFLNWADNEPDEKYSKCVSIYANSGTWRNSNCGRRLSFICEKDYYQTLNTYTKTTTVPTYVNRDETCPSGWILHNTNNVCYKYFKEALTLDEAQKHCESFGQDYNLVSIHNVSDQAFITTLIKNSSSNVWIGNVIAGDYTYWFWIDNSPIGYKNWEFQQPLDSSKQQNNCSMMTTNKYRAGQWIAKNCTNTYSFICQKPLGSSTFSTSNKFQECEFRKEFVKYENHCYKLVEEIMDFEAARKNCERQNATLASIGDAYEASFIHLYRENHVNNIWIGLTNTEDNATFKWIDKWPVYYTKWHESLKWRVMLFLRNKVEEPCVSINYDSIWVKSPCRHQFASLCKITTDKPPTPKKVISGNCPPDDFWFDGGEHCFYVNTDDMSTWGEASLKCIMRDAKLASFLDQDEYTYLLPRLSQLDMDAWIGLYRLNDAQFVWDDKSNVSFSNWETNYPSYKKIEYHYMEPLERKYEENCVSIDRDGKWRNNRCQKRLAFICKKTKDGVEIPKVLPPSPEHLDLTNTNSSAEALQQDTSSEGLGGGTIFGIIFGISVAVVIILILALIVIRSDTLPNFMEGPGRFFAALFSPKKQTTSASLNSLH